MFPPAIRLPDRRRLAYTEAGRPDGSPIVYLHGAIGSPLTSDVALVDTVERMGLRLLIVQRPGFGESTPKPGRTLLDFADDLSDFADALGIGRFGLVGVSAGGPYAIACAYRIPARLTATAAVSSLSPLGFTRRRLRVFARAPRMTTRVGNVVTRHPAPLRRVWNGPALDAFLTATATGVGGLVEDHLITQRPWGFELGEVAGAVHVWHGMADDLVPADHALQLAAALPNCTVQLDPSEGHFFFRRRVADILAGLELDHHRRAAPFARFRADAPAVGRDDRARDRQP
jgi:pimeloyl-ACP methyl ester carboxylesterase